MYTCTHVPVLPRGAANFYNKLWPVWWKSEQRGSIMGAEAGKRFLTPFLPHLFCPP